MALYESLLTQVASFFEDVFNVAVACEAQVNPGLIDAEP
jgi:hypothetical protein